jgi:hypothetical protein
LEEEGYLAIAKGKLGLEKSRKGIGGMVSEVIKEK